MKYIVQDSEGKKMIMTVVSSIPQLPEGFELLGKVEELPEIMAEIESSSVLEKEKAQAKQFLASTDWKVIRHRDQLDAEISTSLSSEEFSQLLLDRQIARDKI
jgi:hypothetical protein